MKKEIIKILIEEWEMFYVEGYGKDYEFTGDSLKDFIDYLKNKYEKQRV